MYASQSRSTLISGGLHGAAVGLVLLLTTVKTVPVTTPTMIPLAFRDISRYLTRAPHDNGGGGGGGRDLTEAGKGVLPRIAPRPFVMPTMRPPETTSIIMMEPAIFGGPDVVVPKELGQLGDPNGVLGRISNGTGGGNGIGTGPGDGVGPGSKSGYGPGPEGGVSGSNPITGKVTAPVLLWKMEPEYSEDARKAKLQGTVLLRIEVNTGGQAQNISVRRGIGLGLDERAIDAVRRWKFKPGYANGKPITTVAYVEVNFRLL